MLFSRQLNSLASLFYEPWNGCGFKLLSWEVMNCRFELFCWQANILNVWNICFKPIYFIQTRMIERPEGTNVDSCAWKHHDALIPIQLIIVKHVSISNTPKFIHGYPKKQFSINTWNLYQISRSYIKGRIYHG